MWKEKYYSARRKYGTISSSSWGWQRVLKQDIKHESWKKKLDKRNILKLIVSVQKQ